MFIDWTVDDATAVNTAATLTMTFTFNLYSADISTGNAAFVASTYYTFAPYITILNADSATIVANPFDAIVMPMEFFIDSSTEVISALFNSGSHLYTTTDWTASDYNTLLLSDPVSAPSAQDVTVTTRAVSACDVDITFDTSKHQCAQLKMTATRLMSTGDTTSDVALDYRAFRIGAGWNVYLAADLTDAYIIDTANYMSSSTPLSSVFAQ
jgi:hypothetical protein